MINAYAALTPGAKLTAYQYEPAPLGAHEVEIEVRYCGICHSDISIIDDDWGMSSYPVIAGHEVVGTVIQLGTAVNDLKVGQTVGLGWYADYCETCEQCQNGDENICSDLTPTIVGHHGGFADKVRANANSVIPLPDSIDLMSAGPLLCGGLTVFNPLIQFDIKPTDKVAVIGIGGLGHLALQFLKAWGCEVSAFTSQTKLQEALTMGAHYTVDSRDSNVMAALPRKFDLILSTVNVKLDWNLYLSKLKPKGRLHFVGATMAPLDISVFNLTEAQRSISGSDTGSMQTCGKMLEFAQRHQVKPVIEIYPFEQINEAIEKLRTGDVRYRIVLAR
ncbi:NADPH-dependent aldehyde reductase Ahr [Methylophaga pinxianii]|uniref:NADPH-dependent aldehyde reductase Ahr n=1 Tax=Methylophaga pinxianii TaxID=2881052 RepID=UPI001CF3E212|nr:NAD(P)-dependent alcohol dehydrogenase [Methylophaga pinxianii]MCB2426164.1 NAD(P)-dependent alcohol dehydrogenase [Methylophaga pinxianii]UPH45034.1 NAD(P)-dependent alcohol dehydrogenase [Methylophaga pinxianii]